MISLPNAVIVDKMIVKAQRKFDEGITLLDKQVSVVWKGHQRNIDLIMLEGDTLWNKKDWRSWKSKTLKIWHKNCWAPLQAIKRISNSKELERNEFFDSLRERCAIVDLTGTLGTKLRGVLDTLFEGDAERKDKLNATLKINKETAQKNAEIDRIEAEKKAEKQRAAKKQKVDIESFAAKSGITVEQAAFINQFKTSAK